MTFEILDLILLAVRSAATASKRPVKAATTATPPPLTGAAVAVLSSVVSRAQTMAMGCQDVCRSAEVGNGFKVRNATMET